MTEQQFDLLMEKLELILSELQQSRPRCDHGPMFSCPNLICFPCEKIWQPKPEQKHKDREAD